MTDETKIFPAAVNPCDLKPHGKVAPDLFELLPHRPQYDLRIKDRLGKLTKLSHSYKESRCLLDSPQLSSHAFSCSLLSRPVWQPPR